MFPSFEPFASAEDAYHRERIGSYFASAAIRRRLRAERRARSRAWQPATRYKRLNIFVG